jgi:hypothetical protein
MKYFLLSQRPASNRLMVILDRQADIVTPLCTQLTYEGLIDEIIGIKKNSLEVNPALTNPVPKSS